jgi:hypothetical protein
VVKKKIIYALIETGHTFTLRHPQIWNDVFARSGETVFERVQTCLEATKLRIQKMSLRVGYCIRWVAGGGHCAPHCAHLRPPEIGWAITPLQLGHGIDSGIVAECWVLSACCLMYATNPSSRSLELFNQSKA